jgi:hypothetical protein
MIKRESVERTAQILIGFVISDLQNGIPEGHAGWRFPTETGIDNDLLELLSQSRYLDVDPEGRIRFKFKLKSVTDKFKSLKLQFEQADYYAASQHVIQQELRKVEEAQHIFTHFTNFLEENPNAIMAAVSIGLSRMLYASNMAAPIDDILEEGFSPKDWMIISTRAIPTLSLTIARKVGNADSMNASFDILKKARLIDYKPSKISIDGETLEKIKRVIKWSMVKENLNDENIIFLGLSWFIIQILDSNNIMPGYEDSSVKIIKMSKNTIESIMKKPWKELLSNLDKTIEGIMDKGGFGVSEILFLPEVL